MEFIIKLMSKSYINKILGIFPYVYKSGEVQLNKSSVINCFISDTLLVLPLMHIINVFYLKNENYFSDNNWIITVMEIIVIIIARLILSVHSLLQTERFNSLSNEIKMLKSLNQNDTDEIKKYFNEIIKFKLSRNLKQIIYEFSTVHSLNFYELLYQFLSHAPLLTAQYNVTVFSTLVKIMQTYIRNLKGVLKTTEPLGVNDVKPLLKSINRLIDCINKIGKIFGFKFLIIILCSYKLLVINMYLAWFEFKEAIEGGRTPFLGISECHWAFLWFAETFAIIRSADTLIKEVKVIVSAKQ